MFDFFNLKRLNGRYLFHSKHPYGSYDFYSRTGGEQDAEEEKEGISFMEIEDKSGKKQPAPTKKSGPDRRRPSSDTGKLWEHRSPQKACKIYKYECMT